MTSRWDEVYSAECRLRVTGCRQDVIQSRLAGQGFKRASGCEGWTRRKVLRKVPVYEYCVSSWRKELRAGWVRRAAETKEETRGGSECDWKVLTALIGGVFLAKEFKRPGFDVMQTAAREA